MMSLSKRLAGAFLLMASLTISSPAFAQPATPVAADTPAPAASPKDKAKDKDKDKKNEEENRWYIGGSAGAVFPTGLHDVNVFAGAPGGGGIAASAVNGWKGNPGFSLGGQVGHVFDNWRVEGEFVYQNWDRNPSALTFAFPGGPALTDNHTGTTTNTYSFLANGYYDFKSQSKWTPYLGGGVGFTSIDTKNSRVSAIATPAGLFTLNTPGVHQTVFAYQIKAGLSYNVSDSTKLFMQYHYLGSSNFNYGAINVGTPAFFGSFFRQRGTLQNHALELGMRVKL